MTVIAYIRWNSNPADFAEYLNNVFPELKFVDELVMKGKYHNGSVIKCTTELTEEKRKEVVNKLKLTSVHFTDKNNYVYN